MTKKDGIISLINKEAPPSKLQDSCLATAKHPSPSILLKNQNAKRSSIHGDRDSRGRESIRLSD